MASKPEHNASAIILGDLHLREDTPTCRTDDYWEAQWRKVDFIRQLQEKHGCPVLQPGDFFDHWKPSPRLLAKTFLHMPNNMLAIYGNHDLPQHSYELRDKCGLYALAAGAPDKIKIVKPGELIEIGGRKLAMVHEPMYEHQVPPWHTDGQLAVDAIKRNSSFDLIVSGDVHDRFVVLYNEQLLVNAGSVMRMTADQINHAPAIYLWYAGTNSVRRVALPAEAGVITRDYLERQEEREMRYQAFIDRLRQEGHPELSFANNLDMYFQQNNTLPSVRRLIYQLLEQGA